MLLLTIIISLTHPTFSQFAFDIGMKPDLTFGDQNDRFDLTSLVAYQNKYYDQDYRRKNQNKRRFTNDDFAYHDSMIEDRGTGAEDYERRLQSFMAQNADVRRYEKLVDHLHGGKKEGKNRRSGSQAENEILLHHAVPVEMKIEGYIQVPLVD